MQSLQLSYDEIEQKRQSKILSEKIFLSFLDDLNNETSLIMKDLNDVKLKMINQMIPNDVDDKKKELLHKRIDDYIDDEIETRLYKQMFILQKSHGITENQYRDSVNHYYDKEKNSIKDLIVQIEQQICDTLIKNPSSIFIKQLQEK